MSITSSAFLDLENLSVRLEGATIFKGIFLALQKGEKITLTGPSGSGKSTLLRCLLGFFPFTGTIRINGELLGPNTVWRLRRHIAYVSQEPDLGPGLVREKLSLPFSYKANHGIAFDLNEAGRLFERFLLPASLQSKQMADLSGGEKQRVALVVALLLQRPLLLLDEAASSLDPDAKRHVREYLCMRDDLTILSVSHDTRDFILSNTMVDMLNLVKEATP